MTYPVFHVEQSETVEREWWMNDITYRSYQLDELGGDYQLWSAKRNIYNDGCYTLQFAVRMGERKVSGWTYFYVNPPTEHDMTLAQAVDSILNPLKEEQQ